MDLKEAITIGGREWKTTYSVICTAALLALEGVEKDNPFWTRELQDAIMEQTDLPNDAKFRAVVYKALTNNTEDGRPLAYCFDRISTPDLTRKGVTRRAYRWFEAVPPTADERRAKIQILIDTLQVELSQIE